MKKGLMHIIITTGLAMTMLTYGGVYAAAENQSISDNISDEAVRMTWIQTPMGWYLVNKEGVKQTGWQEVNGSRYYLASNGVMQTGWQQIDGHWYLLSDSGRMLTGWNKIGNIWYYLMDSGEMCTGWQLIKNRWYFFLDTGRMITGWRLIGDKWYFFDESGSMTVGWRQIGGKFYYFDDKGVMLSDTWIGSYYVDSSGAWVPGAAAAGAKQLQVKNIKQYPELPNGCEVTSLAIVLNYMGYNISKTQLSDNYLPKGSAGKVTPSQAFIGNPRNKGSWYCYSPVIVKCANSYLSAVGSGQCAVNLTGSSFETLFKELDAGRPVIIWGTLGLGSPKYGTSWKVNGASVTKYINLHCFVLTGYDMDKGLVYVSDPLYGNRSYKLSTCKLRYDQLGKQAVVVR